MLFFQVKNSNKLTFSKASVCDFFTSMFCNARLRKNKRFRNLFACCCCLLVCLLVCFEMYGRRGELTVSALDSGSSGPGSSPGRGNCVVFLFKTL